MSIAQGVRFNNYLCRRSMLYLFPRVIIYLYLRDIINV